MRLMLAGLGIDVLRRLWRERIHFHVHRHADGTLHFHAHSHSGESEHPAITATHTAVSTVFSFTRPVCRYDARYGGFCSADITGPANRAFPLAGMGYIALFGIGSIAGMAALSVIIAVPLSYSSSGLTWLHSSLQAVIGISTLMIGGVMIYHIGITGGLLV